MTTLVRWLEHPVAEALGWALLHFVWQGALIAGLLAILMAAMKRAAPNWRYLVLCGGLAAMATFPLGTFCWLISSIERPGSPAIVTATPAPNVPLQIADQPRLGPMIVGFEDLALDVDGNEVMPVAPPERHASRRGRSDFLLEEPEPLPPEENPVRVETPRSWTERWHGLIEPLLPWLVAAWSFGVLALSLRLLAGWHSIRRLRRHGATPAPAIWHDRLSRLAARLRVRTPIALVESALVEVPTVIGWLKPMILLPAAALAGMDPRQLEALLAHELAHIRRHDYLVNLVQTVIETLLFYHPAVWWLSRRIRQEREHCCDDLAVAACGDTLIYARALATMEELRSSPLLTLAANDGSLLGRIQRIVSNTSSPKPRSTGYATPSGLIVLSAAVIGLFALLATAYPRTVAEDAPPADALAENESSQPIEELKEAAGRAEAALAAEPVTGELTPLQQAALEDLKKLYTLPDGEVLKFVRPPLPDFLKMQLQLWVSPPMRQKTQFDLIPWNEEKWGLSFSYFGVTPRLSNLIEHFLKVEQTDIKGDARILQRKLPEDYVYRTDASVEQLAAKLAEIAQQEWQIPVRLSFREVERNIYVAKGDFQPSLPAGETRFALNSGPYAGDHGEFYHTGSVSDFLANASEYLGVKIVNEISPSEARLKWSRRWYDRSTVKPENRFKINPEIVLKQITDQTGLKFTSEKRMMRVVFVETGEPSEPTSDVKRPANAPLQTEGVEFHLKGLGGAVLSSADKKTTFSLPGRWRIPFPDTETSETHFRIDNIPGRKNLVLDGTVICAPRNPATSPFLAADALLVNLDTNDINLITDKGMTSFYFAPHPSPEKESQGKYEISRTIGALSPQARSNTMAHLKRRGIFVAELRLDSHLKSDEVEPKPVSEETAKKIELLQKIAAANKANYEKLKTWQGSGQFTSSRQYDGGDSPHRQQVTRHAKIAFSLDMPANSLLVDWQDSEPIRLVGPDDARGQLVSTNLIRFQSILTEKYWYDFRTAAKFATEEQPVFPVESAIGPRVLIQRSAQTVRNRNHNNPLNFVLRAVNRELPQEDARWMYESEGLIDPRIWTSILGSRYSSSGPPSTFWEEIAWLKSIRDKNLRQGKKDRELWPESYEVVREMTDNGAVVRINRYWKRGTDARRDDPETIRRELTFEERFGDAMTSCRFWFGPRLTESAAIDYEMRDGIAVPVRFSRMIGDQNSDSKETLDVRITEFQINQPLGPNSFEISQFGLQDGDQVYDELRRQGYVMKDGEQVKISSLNHDWKPQGSTSLRTGSLVAKEWNDLVHQWVELGNGWMKKDLDQLTPAERKQAYLQNREQWEQWARRSVALHPSWKKQEPKHMAFECLTKVIQLQYAGSIANEAADQLLKQHQDLFTEDQQSLALQLGYSFPSSLASETVLRALIEKSQSRATQAQARMSLARFLADRAQQKRMIDAFPLRAERVADEYGPWYLDRIQRLDPDAAEREAESLWQDVIANFHDVVDRSEQHEKLAEQARRDLLRQQHAIGRRAPQIAGNDFAEKPLKLSETDGKVRVLIFWGHWCGPCRRHYPYLRQLTAKHADAPFEVLGICSDEDRQTIQKPIDAGDVTWRFWWGGGEDRWRILKEWGLYGSAWIFVLDAQGIVRFAGLDDYELEPAVELLLGEQAKKSN